ncbi:MAG: hypothetical protein U0794_11130 [Isosphaeraceae bacterium]
MAEFRLVVVSREPTGFERIQQCFHAFGETRLWAIRSVDDLATVVESGPVSLVLVVQDEVGEHGGVARALWHLSRARQDVPVVVLGPQYDEQDALTLFQMGVSDYLGFDVHAEQLVDVVEQLHGEVLTLDLPEFELVGDFGPTRETAFASRRMSHLLA